MPDIGDVYYLSNAIFFGFDGNPLGITGPPDHYFVVYDIVGEICIRKRVDEQFYLLARAFGSLQTDYGTSGFFSTKSYYNNIHEDFCFCRSESSAFPLVTELMPGREADPTLGPKHLRIRPGRTARLGRGVFGRPTMGLSSLSPRPPPALFPSLRPPSRLHPRRLRPRIDSLQH